tara:strand:- start:412 stop:1002 length:591 start_codon:yes stop_codon:yes gene_type:complete
MQVVTEKFFATGIGYSLNENNKNIKDKLVKRCLEIKNKTKAGGEGWLANKTYNTIHTDYNLLEDKTFADLHNWIFGKVGEYMGSNYIKSNVKPENGWFNIYNKGDFQEFHLHTGSALSVIYFLKSPKGGSKVWFKSPVEDMVELQYNKEDPYAHVTHESVEGKLLIFRSHIHHAVEQHPLDESRITLAYNFAVQKA